MDTLEYLLGLSLVTRLAKEGEHILLVCLHTRLIERIDAKGVCTHATGKLKEVEDGAKSLLIDAFDAHLDLRHATVNVGKFGSELGHCIAMFHPLACKIVELVKILLIAADDKLPVGVLNLDCGLKHYTLAFLDKLSHRVKIGCAHH